MDRSKKHSRNSDGEGRPQKTARVGASSDLSRLDELAVPRRREGEDKEVTVTRLVLARDVKGDVVLPLVWDNPDAMAYVRSDQKFLDAQRFGSFPCHGRATRVMFQGRSRCTVYGAWDMRQEAWGHVKEHGADGMDMPVLRDDSEKLYVANLVKFTKEEEAGRLPKDWLGYCVLPWPYQGLPFLTGSWKWRDRVRFERRHRLDTGRGYFVGWHNTEFFPVSGVERRRLYVPTPLDWKIREPCRALAVPSSPVFAYKANMMVDIDDAGTPGAKKERYMNVALADHTVMMIMQFLQLAWPWSRDRIVDIPGYDPRMAEGGRGLLFPLPEGIMERVRRVGMSRIVSGTRYSPVRALAAVMCSLSICWGHEDVLGWYPYDFTTGNVYAVPPRLSHKGKDCPGSEPRSQFGMIAKHGADRMAGATERIKMEADRAAAEERDRWNEGLTRKTQKTALGKRTVAEHGKGSRAEVPARVVDTGESVVADDPVVVIEDSMAPVDDVEATPVVAGARSLQVTGDIVSQRSTGGGVRP